MFLCVFFYFFVFLERVGESELVRSGGWERRREKKKRKI